MRTNRIIIEQKQTRLFRKNQYHVFRKFVTDDVHANCSSDEEKARRLVEK